MNILNIRIRDIKKQIKLIYNLYKNNLKDILNSSIYNIVANIIYIN